MPLMGLTLTYAHKHSKTAYMRASHGEQNEHRQESKCDCPTQQVAKICLEKGVKEGKSGRSDAI
jgi:hypothetical protein